MAHPFQALGIPTDLIKGIEELGIHRPTEIQEKAIPFLTEDGGNLIAQAQTGTGKTAAFGLPLLTKIQPKSKEIQGLVIAPTRELAKQIGKQLFRYTKYSAKVFTEVLCGGDDIDRQAGALQRPTQIVVATPGRLLDLIKRKALTLEHVRYLILDEADEMLSMGFKKELSKILALAHQRKSTWLFSATFPDSVNLLVRDCMADTPRSIKIDRGHVVNRDISHRYAICRKDEKNEFISNFLRRHKDDRGLIFCRTKAGAITLAKQLTNMGHAVDVLQGDLTQKERDKVMRAFKKQRFSVLIATDVAARGIDVEQLAFVIHHQLPDQTEYYTHRSGRTARAGLKGISIALIDPRERKSLARLERELDIAFQEM
ncbi:DEAD/DEAH box helicase [Haloferula rosea]|uniref:DEAD/DEAH box helicase n=1 Tax=Haloferula rosea TaxID=490093 RepID=A0A934VGY3_9BACT|nr:DEAD/DEAH box helicase [Haloferula rosea]MBK1828512.1 DEAD/DEAH box helicase [Haloferula rosea]